MEEIIKIASEINDMEDKPIEKYNYNQKQLSLELETINVMNNPLPRLTQKKREKIEITNMRDEYS